MDAVLEFLQRYKRQDFLDKIVTGDETWVNYKNIETKEQSKQRLHSSSPNKPIKAKQTFSNIKLIATVFWDRKLVLLIEFNDSGMTVSSTSYCNTLQRL